MKLDLSVIEMAGEDDTIQQSPMPADDVINFGCSPLYLPRSQISATKIKAGAGGSSTSSSYSNKENHDTCNSNSGTPSLSVESQKMKRSRKGNGYSLRKSLAWDKAFFTEEGVLNPLELSMISGTLGKLDGDSLSIIDEEFPSGYPNERKTMTSSFLKRESLIAGGSLAAVSKSSQKIASRHSVNKSVFKGGVTRSPTAPSSQKRILTMGSTQVATRNSKVPKFPVAKQGSLPHMTVTHISAGQSSLRPLRIAHPATQKSRSLKTSSNMKNASAGKTCPKGNPKSTNFAAESARKDKINSSTEMTASKMSKLLTSDKELPNGGADVVDSVCGISRTTVSSHCSSVTVGGSQVDVQGRGLKPSGLRMPSPSLRFFSEPRVPGLNAPSKYNIKPSNLVKLSISTSRNPAAVDHAYDLKPAQSLQGAIDQDATDKTRLRLQMTDKCSAASIADSTIHDKLSDNEYSDQKAEDPVQTDNWESRSAVLDVSNKKCMSHVWDSLMNEDKDSKDSKPVSSSHVESGEAKDRTSIVFQENKTHENISENYFQPCLEVQVINVFENRKSQQQLVEYTGYISSVSDHEVLRGSQNEVTGSCNTKFTEEDKHSQSVGIEYQQQHVDNNQGDITVDVELSTGVSECLEVQVDLREKDNSSHMHGNFSKKEELPLKSKNHGSKEISDTNPEVAEGMGHKLSIMNSPVMVGSETDSISCQNYVTPVAASGPSSSIVDDSQLHVKSNIHNCNSAEEVAVQADSPTLLPNNGNFTARVTDLELPTSAKRSHNMATCPVVGSNIESLSSPRGGHELQPNNFPVKAAIDNCTECDKPVSNISQTECGMITTSQDVHAFVSENKCDKKAIDCIVEEVTKSQQRTCPDDQKRAGPPPNAIPFSDEWLAAIEAAGEEILTLKTGAVQNSPPDKSVPEPSPWSPVKRNGNQVIGPFDCTKYAHTQHNNSD